jgi:hypothetical protein
MPVGGVVSDIDGVSARAMIEGLTLPPIEITAILASNSMFMG